jgi:hypothetical protein
LGAAGPRLQRLGDGLAHLAQPSPTATQAGCRSRYDHSLTGQMLGNRLACGALTRVGERLASQLLSMSLSGRIVWMGGQL